MVNAAYYLNYTLIIIISLVFSYILNINFDNIDKRFDNIDKRFDNISKRFDNIDKRFDNISKRFDNIDKRFDNISKRFDNIDKNFDTINKRLDNMEKKYDANFDELNAKKARDNSTLSSLYIYVQDKNGKPYHASGNLVNINDDHFAATCRHTIYDEDTKEELNVIFITNYGRNLTIGKRKYLYFKDKEYDLALIPIDEDEDVKKNAALISNTTVKGGQKLYGMNYYDDYYSYGECYVVSTKKYPRIITNCPGKPRYSGTGYFNSTGFLTAIHKGRTEDEDESSEEYPKVIRNTRSVLVDAKHLLRLYELEKKQK